MARHPGATSWFTALAAAATATAAGAGCPRGGVGDACDDAADCRSGLICSPSGTCQQPPGGPDGGTDASFPPCEGCMICPLPPTCPAMCDICPPDAGSDSAVATDATIDAAATDAGAAGFGVTLAGVMVFGNCMPIVPADPWSVSFDATYDNTAGATSVTATITSVDMTFSGAGTPVLMLTVTPTGSGSVPAGGTTVVSHTKTGSTGAVPDCSHCGDTVTLAVTYDVGGTMLVATSAPAPVMCAF